MGMGKVVVIQFLGCFYSLVFCWYNDSPEAQGLSDHFLILYILFLYLLGNFHNESWQGTRNLTSSGLILFTFLMLRGALWHLQSLWSLHV
jgi:hypothetical protein